MTGGRRFDRGNRRAAKLTAVKVEEMRLEYELGMTQRELGEKYELSVGQVGRIVRGESWADTGVAQGFVERRAREEGRLEGKERGSGEEIPGRLDFETPEGLLDRLLVLQTRNGIGSPIPEGIKQRAKELLGEIGPKGEPEELGPVGVEELPVEGEG